MPSWPGWGWALDGRVGAALGHLAPERQILRLDKCHSYPSRLLVLPGCSSTFRRLPTAEAGVPRYPGQLARTLIAPSTVRRTERVMRRLAWAGFSSVPASARVGLVGGGCNCLLVQALPYTISRAACCSLPAPHPASPCPRRPLSQHAAVHGPRGVRAAPAPARPAQQLRRHEPLLHRGAERWHPGAAEGFGVRSQQPAPQPASHLRHAPQHQPSTQRKPPLQPWAAARPRLQQPPSDTRAEQ